MAPMEPQHDEFRDLCRAFLSREVVPHYDRWEADGVITKRVALIAPRSTSTPSIRMRPMSTRCPSPMGF